MNQTICPEDLSFGPNVSPQCRHGLDLTLVFEESILSILPASFMIVASTARYVVLRRSRRVVSTKSFYDTKSVRIV
jgi:ATP-binding cassette subfamily C (CFTR/MRP) protein 1